MGPRNHVLDGGRDLSLGRGTLGGDVPDHYNVPMQGECVCQADECICHREG